MEPAYLTFRPDNYLTVGLIMVTVYLGAVLLAQVADRAGLINLATPATGPSSQPGTVVNS